VSAENNVSKEGTLARRAAAVVAAIAWGAIGAQVALNLGNAAADGESLWLVPFRLYGYFTIWANTLVALVTTHAALGGDRDSVLARSGTLAATTVYIIFVGIIYNTLLAGMQHLDGVPKLVDLMLHGVIPVAYPLWWLICTRRGRLGWGHALPAMGLPLAYCCIAMGRGLLTGKYAYFFIDIDKYGLSQVVMNIAALMAFFVGLMAALIALDRWLARNDAPAATG
jgi:hypothetical protein